MDGDRKQSQDRIKNIWVSQAVVRNLYFILRVTEMRWRILRWGIPYVFKRSLWLLYREKTSVEMVVVGEGEWNP